MDAVKKWALNLAVILLVCAVIKFLMPSGNISKSAKIALSLTVLAVMLSFSSAVKNTDLSFSLFEDVELTQQYDPYAAAIENAVESTLENGGIACRSVKVDGQLGGDGVFVINSVEITVASADAQRALSYLENNLGIERGAVSVNED